ncbi:putative transcriptional regulator [Pararhizobium capsulatum DSM 1112]|uniref:Transcriptional regulator n=1 Tax=Pararhizobium capsulatum DSM 1112 TaxID=1121113 RepID=A0ABU0BTF5_9HYPH|nr:ChrR family anti-sigma-E factor [Pararhizobium capsulatum]MDQ0320735.1 putative transcriptional regulator [Pararhizobium capsulatum DSM 1112]
MTVRHEVSDELLASYAAGTLAEGWRLAVATHLALAPHARRRLALFEKTAGQMLEDIQPEAPAGDVWVKIRAKIDNQQPSPVSTMPRAAPEKPSLAPAPVLPEPLRSYLGGDVMDLKWRTLGRGAYHIPIRTEDGETNVRLLRIPAGKPVPEHSHGGRELTLVLSGSFQDSGELFARGDIEEADATLTHQPIATPGEDCICLAVTDAPLRFKSMLLRLVQPLLGI